MQELTLNLPTVAVLLVIAALAFLALRRMMRRGLCDCGDHDAEHGGCAGCAGCGGCSGSSPAPAPGACPACATADKMEAAAKKNDRS